MSTFRARPNRNTKIVNILQTEEAVFWLSALNLKLLNFFLLLQTLKTARFRTCTDLQTVLERLDGGPPCLSGSLSRHHSCFHTLCFLEMIYDV